MTTSEHEFLTVSEAAALLRVSKSTIWRWIEAGRLPAVRIGTRTVRLRNAEVLSASRRDDRPVAEPWWRKYATQWGDPSIPEEELMARVHEINEQILRDRGGKPLDDSLPYIHAAREEREEHL